MSAQTGPVHLILSADSASLSAAIASLGSVADVLVSTGAALEAIPDGFGVFFGPEFPGCLPDLILDRSDLFFAEAVLRPAGGALEFIFNPSDRYLEFVTAIAGCGHVTCDADLHGWPILSVAPDSATVAEAGGESIFSARGGLRS
jgi:hypothetical protein